MKIRTLALTLITLTACGYGDNPNHGSYVDDGEVFITGSALEACIERGVPLTELWSVNNGHGSAIDAKVHGDSIYISSADGSVKRWDLRARQLEGSLEGTGIGGIYGAEVNTDAETYTLLSILDDSTIAAGSPRGIVSILSSDSEGLSVGEATMEIGDSFVASLAWSPSGEALFIADHSFGGNIRRWDIAGSGELGEVIATGLWDVVELYVTSVEDGREILVAVGNWYGVPSIEIFDSNSGESLGWWVGETSGDQSTIKYATLLAGGSLLISTQSFDTIKASLSLIDVGAILGSEMNSDNDGEVIIKTQTSPVHETFSQLGEARSSTVVATAGDEVIFYSPNSLEPLSSMQFDERIISVAYADLDALVTVSLSGDLSVWGCNIQGQ